MRILFILPRSIEEIGGIENCIKNISLKLSNQGHEIDILCTKWRIKKIKIRQYTKNIRIIQAKRKFFKNKFYYSSQLIRYFKRNRLIYDQIHIQSIHALTSLCLLYAPKEKTTFTPHYHPSSGKGTFFRKIMFKVYLFLFVKKMINNSSAIITDTVNERDLIIRTFGVNKKYVIVIPLAVSNLIKKTKPFETKPKNILYVGRFEEQKGVIQVIDVFVKLLEEFVDIQLNLVGDGILLSKIKKIIKEKRIEDKVNIHRNIPSKHLYELYSRADLFLMLSKHEAFGIAIAEAIASGVPTIATATYGVVSYLENEKNGFLVNIPFDIEYVVNIAAKILSNYELRNSLRERGLELTNVLSWEKTSSKLINVLQ